jgi:hypothetical protein
MGIGFAVRSAAFRIVVASDAVQAGANPPLWRFRDSKAGLSVGAVTP